MVAQNFISENEELFEEYSSEYQIFTNYLDSHIWFEDEKVQSKFDES